MNILYGYIITFIYIFSVLLGTKVFKKVFKFSPELSRKLIHILASFPWVISFFYFKDTWHMAIPPLAFTAINYISYKTNLFPIMERSNDDSLGTVYYPLATFLMAIASVFDNRFLIPYGIGLFCMAFGDGLAPLLANKIKSPKIWYEKTLAGTLTVFICSLLVALTLSIIFNVQFNILDYLLIGLVSALIELVSQEGLDNLFLPIGVSILSYILIIF